MFPLLLLLFLLLLSGSFFSAVETALIAISRHRLQDIAEEKPSTAKDIHRWLNDPNRMLTTILVGINVVAVSTSAITTRLMDLLVAHFHLPLWTGLALSILLVSVVVIMFGEIIPKIVAYHSPEPVALALLRPLALFDRMTAPLTQLMVGICQAILRSMGIKTTMGEGPFVTESEVLRMLSTGEKQGVFEKSERDMIRSIFEFGDTMVREVMVPRPDIKSFDANRTIAEAARYVEEVRHSRVPLREGNLENIVGFVDSRSLMMALRAGKDEELAKTVMRETLFVPETKKLGELLREFQERRLHLAIVLDEFGVTAGIVTLEDLLEEIVGEIWDEYDREEPVYRWIEEGKRLRADGRINLDELGDVLNVKFPDEEAYETLGGLVFAKLGWVPKPGDVVRHEDLDITVEQMSGKRVSRVIITVRPPVVKEEPKE